MCNWIARDRNGSLHLFSHIPVRCAGDWLLTDAALCHDRGWCVRLDDSLFPNLTWEDEPLELNLEYISKIQEFGKWLFSDDCDGRLHTIRDKFEQLGLS